MKKFSILLFPLFLLFISCDTKKAQDETDDYASINFDTPFKLDSAKGVKMKDDDLTISLKTISEDSRCPTGTTCVWAGQVKLLLQIESGGTTSELELTKKGKSSEVAMAKTKDYQIMLMEINPYPKEGEKLKLADYVLTMVVQR